MRYGLLLLIGLTAAAQPAAAQMTYGKAPMVVRDPELEGKAEVEPKLGAQLPLDELFHDHDGNEVTLRAAMAGKPTIFILGYSSCPKLCNELLNDTVDALRTLARLGLTEGKDYNLVRVSINPKESPTHAYAMRANYLEVLDPKRSPAEPGFAFLTAGKGQGTDVMAAREKILKLADAVGFRYVADNQAAIDKAGEDGDRVRQETAVRKSKDFVHASALFILSPDGKLNTVLQGLKTSSQANYGPDTPKSGWTVEDLRLGLQTAASGKLGSFYSQAVMRCFAYDKDHGDYRLAMRAMGLLALPFPFIIGLIAWTAWRRSRTEKKLTPADVAAKPAEPGVYPQPSLN